MGNWGILDQQVALQWVNRYIGALGGDPENVAISGCSAGGQSTMVHLSSPTSWPYFNKVVAFSSPNGIPFKVSFVTQPTSLVFKNSHTIDFFIRAMVKPLFRMNLKPSTKVPFFYEKSGVVKIVLLASWLM